MEFRTSFKPQISEKKIDLESTILTVGSCFSTTMGKRLSECKFNVLNNPFGTVYNPTSINHLFELAIQKLKPNDYFLERDSIWFHHEFHSDFYGASKEELQYKIDDSLDKVYEVAQKADFIIITLGTAVVYELYGVVISNCHKVPQKQFSKTILTADEIRKALVKTTESIFSINEGCQILLTVSPVRHIKDSIPLNSRSKALLIASANELADRFSQVQYFPSYEMMIDDLRDYRFYEDDLIHPTSLAEDYIWENFRESYFSNSTQELVNQLQSLKNDLNHRPFQPESESHQKFLRKLLKKLENLSDRVNVVGEIKSVRNQLK